MAELIESVEQQQTVKETSPEVRRSRSGFWFGLIILLVIAVVSGAGYYFLSQLRDKQEGLGGEVKGAVSQQISDYQAQLAAIQSQLAAVQTDVGNKEAHFTNSVTEFSKLQNEKLDSTRKDLSDEIQKLQRQLGKTRGDWLLADAEYLLSVANQRLLLMGDVNTTKEALEAADQRLRESGDAAAYKVREQLAKDIAAISKVNAADVVGIYSTLQMLESQIDSLTLLLPYAGKDEVIKPVAPEVKKEPKDLMGQLETMVTIRHVQQHVNEILTPEQAQFIREQLRVKLEIIKIALVQQNDVLYQASLADTNKWLLGNFAKEKEADRFIASLEKLADVRIRTQFPDISLSLKLLRDITKLRIETDKGLSNPAKSTPVVDEAAQQ
ncbi:MAG: uroporphyrinogen-III C-methyltransferase [Methylococcales bacterium]|nr:uroporphyrinogen-III C-methyltransferase [Methylococcales bacterium]MDD5754947.1 uroporphyrinogen-III C-methyltransferase [Methylococcales bacterium]